MSKRNFIAQHVAALPKSGIRKFFDIVAQRKDVVSLGVGEPDFDTPWHISRAAVTALEDGATHYTSNLGTPELRQAIAAYVQRRFNAKYDWKKEILVTVGVSEAIDLAIRAITEPGDEILYHEPCFVSYAPTIRMAHGVPVCVETNVKDDFRLTVAALEAKVTPKTKALLLNFPCNPTGATLTHADFKAIAKFVLKHDLLLLADEVYSELSYDGKVLSFSSLPELKDNMVLLNGFSKSWAMTGYRLGYACGSHAVVDTMMKIHQYGIMSAIRQRVRIVDHQAVRTDVERLARQFDGLGELHRVARCRHAVVPVRGCGELPGCTTYPGGSLCHDDGRHRDAEHNQNTLVE